MVDLLSFMTFNGFRTSHFNYFNKEFNQIVWQKTTVSSIYSPSQETNAMTSCILVHQEMTSSLYLNTYLEVTILSILSSHHTHFNSFKEFSQIVWQKANALAIYSTSQEANAMTNCFLVRLHHCTWTHILKWLFYQFCHDTSKNLSNLLALLSSFCS